MIDYAHVIVDLQAGDTGKGKVAHSLCKTNKYTHVVRYNGGGNAGHTVYHRGNKIVTHFIPVGVLYGIKSIIGPGCVINVAKLFDEIKYLESFGFKIKNNLFIDKRAHIITKEHITEDARDKSIGTTKTGNGPAYRDKYDRKGVRAENYKGINIIDIYEEFYGKSNCKILFEGAQGFELDIDWGDYPYVTSSHCTVGSAILNGVPPQKITKVYGVAKAYRTYVGAKNFETPSDVFDKIRELGEEYGATTGRKRQIDWLNVNDLIKSANINGVTDLVINKLDILEQTELKLYHNSKLHHFLNVELFKEYIIDNLQESCPILKNITFSLSPFDI